MPNVRKISALPPASYTFLGGYGHTQDPVFRQITTSEGLPSNEVYSIVQDLEGFVWIGCDAGLNKYNGISFQKVSGSGQSSSAISGLVITRSGNIFCNTFNGQILFTQADSLVEVSQWSGKVGSVTEGLPGQVWISGNAGVSLFSQQDQSLKQLSIDVADLQNGFSSGCAFYNSTLYFKTDRHVVTFDGHTIQQIPCTGSTAINLGDYMLGPGAASHWLFPRYGNNVLRYNGTSYQPWESTFLNTCL